VWRNALVARVRQRACGFSPRAFGAAALLVWSGLALEHRGAWPHDGMITLGASLAAACALAPVARCVTPVLLAPPRAALVGACALAAAALSWSVVRGPLAERPLSIDAGVYLFQARALAHGHFGAPPPLPAQAFGDRFVLEGPDGRLYGIFPPGWPLAIVPFVWLGRPMLVGPAVAALLVLGQASLGGALARARANARGATGRDDSGEVAMRASLLLSLPSVARALETADLLSHAFVAILSCFALSAALTVGERTRTKAALAGTCVAWAVAARLLDGLVLAGTLAGVLLWTRAPRRAVAWCALGALPLLLLLAIEQRTATGAWLTPTQTAYFERSDFPPSCHRLGFGPDVGCTVEHPGPVARLGGRGFHLRDGVAVARERAEALGEDALGFAPLALLAFAPLLAASAVDAAAVAFVLALTLAYGLFYYGNAFVFGARHLFPAAPFLWLLVARGAATLPHRARGWFDARHVRGGAIAVVVAVAAFGSRAAWAQRLADAASFQANRSDLRRTMDVHAADGGILKTRDYTALAAALDPWADDGARMFVLEDGSGLLELRRAHPQLPVLLSLPGDDLGRIYAGAPPAGTLIELERAWPSFVRPRGLATRQAAVQGASGGSVLQVSHAAPGAELLVPFDVAVPDDYSVRIDGFAGPEDGDYDITLDGEPMPPWSGYAPVAAATRTAAVRRAMTSGRHLLALRCTGRDAASTGFGAQLDALVGVAAVSLSP
jgi:hypothetical protein